VGRRASVALFQLLDCGPRTLLVVVVSRGTTDSQSAFHFPILKYGQSASHMQDGRDARQRLEVALRGWIDRSVSVRVTQVGCGCPLRRWTPPVGCSSSRLSSRSIPSRMKDEVQVAAPSASKDWTRICGKLINDINVIWRRKWDSNRRYGFRYVHLSRLPSLFASERLQRRPAGVSLERRCDVFDDLFRRHFSER
jgi:hypothetical protein